MTKELTPLEALKAIGKLKENGCHVNATVEYKIIKKALKALETVKEKGIDIITLRQSETLRDYNDNCCYYERLNNKEQFDLLKEVLK